MRFAVQLSGRSHFSEHLPGKYLERLALSLGRVQRLCADPRESRRLARLLSPTPLPSQSSLTAGGAPAAPAPTATCTCPHAGEARPPAAAPCPCPCHRCSSGGCRGSHVPPGAADASAVLVAYARGSSARGGLGRSGQIRGASRRKAGRSPTWSPPGSIEDVGGGGAAPVAFAEVLQAFCRAERGGYEGDHAAVASVMPNSPPPTSNPDQHQGHDREAGSDGAP